MIPIPSPRTTATGLRQRVIVALAALLLTSALPPDADAQFDFLQSLFGRRQATPAVFQGQPQLAQARVEAERGDVQKSFALVREALQTVTAPLPPGDPVSQSIASQLLELSRLWSERQAPPELVAEVLRDVVLPPKSPNEVRLYAVLWQSNFQSWNSLNSSSRDPQPRSVARELVTWSRRANQTTALRTRLDTALKAPQASSSATALSAQLAVAERDDATANRQLVALAATTPSVTDAAQLETCLHAVAAAVRRDETQAAGLALLEAMLDRWDVLVPQPPVGSGINSTWLRFHAARRHLQAGRIDDGVRLALTAAVKPLNDQAYGADFAAHLRRMQVAEAASILLAAGRVSEALDLLGPLVDAPDSRYSMYYPGPNVAAMLGRELQQRPSAERYELLRRWTLPDGDRSALRDLTDFVPGDPTDDRSAVALPAAGLLHDVYSTSWDLVRTAKELGKLDELLRELDAISPQTLQTQALETLGGVLSGGTTRSRLTTEGLTALLAATTQNIPKWEEQQKTPFPMLTFVVAAEAARHPEWHDVSQQLLERLIEHTQRLQWDRPRAHVRMAWAEVVRRRNGGDAKLSEIAPSSATASVPEAWDNLRPKSWIASGMETVAQHANGSLPDVWLAQDGYVQHLTGPYDSHLFFQYPLTGDFEIALDGREGGWAEGYTGYGGALFAVNGYVDRAPLRAPGGTGYVPGPQLTNLLHKSPWNQQRIQVSGGGVRYLANGQLIHEDRPGDSSPWLSLGADWGRTPIFRNLRVTGTPVIPREVSLLADARLRGWVSEYYGETRRDPLRELPTQAVRADPATGDNDVTEVVMVDGTPATVAEQPTDWFWKSGELRSPQRESFWPGVVESRMYYHRPLCPAETVLYEFFYREGELETHPTIGRRAFVLQPNGVTTHWLTDGELDVRGLPPDNGAFRERKLPLKPDDWNAVEIAMHADAVHIRLNGELIVEQPLASRDSRTFGFYHDASLTAVRVRDAVLRGDWPREFNDDLRAAIEHPQPENPPADGRFATAIMTEPYFADNAYAVYRRALALEPAARFDYLTEWVMPGATHDTLRMAGSFTPTHPAPPVLAENPIDVATAEARQTIDGRRVQTGGNFVCPAILLVLSAAELNRLDELGEAVFKLDAASSPAQARARTAMLGIIALLQDRPAETLDAVWECTRLVLASGPTEQHHRWSEPALCSLAILHPATREAAYELLDRIQGRQLQAGQPGTPEFGRYVRQLHGQVHYLMHGGDPSAFGSQPQLAQWRTVPQPCARTRGGGYPIGAYDAIAGELALRGGHDLEMAYFQSPLRGNYEVRARLSQFDYREFMPYVAGVSNVLKFTHRNVKVQSLRGAAKEVPTPQEIVPRVKSWADYRLVVQDGHYLCYVGDQVLYEADVSPNADPWVAFAGWAGQSSRAARNVVITGTPEIPDELELLNDSDLRGWLVDYYGTATGQTPYPWRLEDGELKSDQTVIRGATPGRLKVENVIRYHRPLLEDGEISYEFFYDPELKVPEPVDPQRNFAPLNQPQPRLVDGQAIVHPALDRLVCLLEPDGVKVHWLTDGRYDRTGLLPGNVTVEAGRGPQTLSLKPQAWNSIRLVVAGDTLTIFLNDKPVFVRPIEPTNLRQFGLFHYVNESSARVRNVRYRGDWPKTLPAVDQQELAVGPEQFAEIPPEQLPARVDYDFTGAKFDPPAWAYHWNSQASGYVHPTAEGLRMTLPAGQAKPQVAGVHPKLRISGDFIATLEYSDLKVLPVKEQWGSGLSFKVALDQSYEAGFEVRQWQNSNGTSAMWQIVSPHKQYLYYSESNSEFPDSGRLRIVRRGPVLYFLTAPLGSDEFRLLTQRPIGTNDVKAVNLQADCSDQAGMADVVVRNLSIRAAKITPVK